MILYVYISKKFSIKNSHSYIFIQCVEEYNI